jgi:hypothetical protein
VIIPVSGFGSVAHASRQMIASVQVKPAKDSVSITHAVAGALAPLGDVTLATTLYGVRSKASVQLQKLVIPAVGFDPVSAAVTWNQPQTEPMVIRVHASGKDWQEDYEAYYEGEFKPTIYPGYPYKPEYTRLKPGKKE